MAKIKRRFRSVRRLRRYLLKKQSPRRDMAGVLALTGLTGFVASVWMLRLGLTSMWLRYPAAAAVAYGFFLVMIILVVDAYGRGSRESFSDLSDLVPDPPEGGPGPGLDISGDGLDLGLDLGGDEGCLMVVIVALVAGLLLVAAYVVYVAPTLLAELLLDSLLIGGLYRRLRKAEPGNLYLSAFRLTLGPAVLAIVFLAFPGAGLESYAPDAVSIGSAFAKWSAPR